MFTLVLIICSTKPNNHSAQISLAVITYYSYRVAFKRRVLDGALPVLTGNGQGLGPSGMLSALRELTLRPRNAGAQAVIHSEE